MMRAIVAKTVGGPEVLSIVEVPKPTPGPEQLLVRVHAAALNRADILQRRGKYPLPPDESPILGLEIAGEVVALGQAATHFNIGDRVFGLVGSGGYAEYCVIDHRVAMPIPDGLTFQEAAAIPEAFLTASEALCTLGQLQKNETVLIHAGASGVGSAAIQLAKYQKATVITTVGSPEKMAAIQALGADQIINYKQESWFSHLPPIDVIIDFIGARYLSAHLQRLAPNGRLICVGLMGGARAEIDLGLLLSKRLHIHGLIMRTRSLTDKRFMSEHFQNTWLPLFKNRQLIPIIDSEFHFADVQKAHTHMEDNKNIGKIILNIL